MRARVASGRESQPLQLGDDGELGLVLALLLEYAEIGMVRVVPGDHLLQLGFLLSDAPSEDEVNAFAARLASALGAYFRLGFREESRSIRVHSVESEGMGALYVERRAEAFAADEIGVIVGMVAEVFGKSLMVEEVSRARRSEEGVFLTSSGGMPATRRRREVIGFREGARLLLFDGA